MLKLLKYEFRKARTPLMVMLSVTAALEAYFLVSLYSLEDEEHLAISMVFLMMAALAAYIVVLVRGVSSYSGELKSRSSYLIFMTPCSTRKIMASKFLFTLALCALFGALYTALCVLDVRLMLEYIGEYEAFLLELNNLLLTLGIHVDQIVIGALFTLLYMALSMLSFFAVAYLAVTLSHTLFRDKSWRGFMAFLFYGVMNYALTEINALFPWVYNALHVVQDVGTAEAVSTDVMSGFTALLIYVVPQALVSLGTIVGSLFGCAWMLDKKISL